MMPMQTYLLQDDSYPLDAQLAPMLAKAGEAPETLALPHDHEGIIQLFQDKPAGAVFLPTMWEDLFCVKIINEFEALSAPFACVIVGPAPEPFQLIAAFNNGLSGYLQTPLDPDLLQRTLARVHTTIKKREEQAALARYLKEYEAGHLTTNVYQHLTRREHALGSAFLHLARHEGPLAGGATRALIVSSSVSQQRALATALRTLHFAVDTASTMAEGLQMIPAKDYNLVISDGTLPDADATDFSKQLQKLGLAKLPRFVVWSSSPEKTPALLKPENHIDDVILKRDPKRGVESCIPTLITAIYQMTD